MTTTKYDICFSITAHENIAVVYNLYDNIVKWNADKKCLVVFRMHADLYAQRDSIPSHPNLLFCPITTPMARFTSTIFLGHVDNYNYICGLGRQFDFFCILASDCLFVRTPAFEAQSLRPRHTLYKYPNTEIWMSEEFFANTKLVDIFYKNGVEVKIAIHEGGFFRRDVFAFIVDFCRENNLPSSGCIPYEEIVLPSLEKFATGKNPVRYNAWMPRITMADVVSVIETGKCRTFEESQFCIVAVPRDMENKLRKFVNEHTDKMCTKPAGHALLS